MRSPSFLESDIIAYYDSDMQFFLFFPYHLNFPLKNGQTFAHQHHFLSKNLRLFFQMGRGGGVGLHKWG